MILLRADEELRQTFERTIGAMKAPVEWNGIFAVVDNYIILQGEVRSLFFHFDTRKVTTNIIDIPVDEEQVSQIADNVCLQNVINMLLYVFGKWGSIEGIKVNKDFAELGRLFTGILRELEIEPDYTREHLRFYQGGIRITYEDVVSQALLREKERVTEEDQKPSGGLWRRMIWKRRQTKIRRAGDGSGPAGEGSLREEEGAPGAGTPQKAAAPGGGRLGNNFYVTGYLCPVCGDRLHMVVYPEGRETQIETDEGGVLLARACTCSRCHSFYTPRPGCLVVEGDVYLLEFADDTAAYEDYLGLLGRRGEKTSNYNYNEFVDPRKREEQQREQEQESLEELCGSLPELPEEELEKLVARMEEGFYPEESVRRFGDRIRERYEEERGRAAEAGKRSARADDRAGSLGEGAAKAGRDARSGGDQAEESGGSSPRPGGKAAGGEGAEKPVPAKGPGPAAERGGGGQKSGFGGPVHGEAGRSRPGREAEGGAQTAQGPDGRGGADKGRPEAKKALSPEQEHARKKYEARMQMLDRYSDRQLRELKSQLEHESLLTGEDKEGFLSRVSQRLSAGLLSGLSKKVDTCADKSYALMKRVLDEVEESELSPEQKAPLKERLSGLMQRQASREVEQLVRQMPANLDRARCRTYLERIRSYEGVDLSPYEERLEKSREAAERQEIANLVKRARKISREDLTELIQRLESGDFLPELVLPYVEKLKEKLRGLDEERIAEFCPNPMQMTFDEGMEAYERIAEGDFLPELKEDTLRALTKRLQKLKTDECGLLVQKLQSELAGAGIRENPRHHFYPARKVMLKQAAPQETEIFEYAMACYAADRGLFEYPILLVDTARNQSGKEGIILTPDHLFYSTMLNAYGIPVSSIRSIRASSGLLNKGVTVVQKDGTKTKLPYAVDAKELSSYAEVLDGFVRYLQEKPDSRKVTYLAKEHHEKICCFRCGFEYRGGSTCPKCGCQNNG